MKLRYRPHPFTPIFIGYLLSLTGILTMYITFLKAYLHPSQTTLVYINRYGEAQVEFILIPLTLGVVFYGLYRTYYYLQYDFEMIHEPSN